VRWREKGTEKMENYSRSDIGKGQKEEETWTGFIWLRIGTNGGLL
jgi:hypothetical protein